MQYDDDMLQDNLFDPALDALSRSDFCIAAFFGRNACSHEHEVTIIPDTVSLPFLPQPAIRIPPETMQKIKSTLPQTTEIRSVFPDFQTAIYTVAAKNAERISLMFGCKPRLHTVHSPEANKVSFVRGEHEVSVLGAVNALVMNINEQKQIWVKMRTVVSSLEHVAAFQPKTIYSVRIEKNTTGYKQSPQTYFVYLSPTDSNNTKPCEPFKFLATCDTLRRQK